MVDQLNTLTTVLSEKLLQIADYQRPYAWEDKQLGDLWDDLDLLGTESHYAGTLVLQRTTEPTGNRPPAKTWERTKWWTGSNA